MQAPETDSHDISGIKVVAMLVNMITLTRSDVVACQVLHYFMLPFVMQPSFAAAMLSH